MLYFMQNCVMLIFSSLINSIHASIILTVSNSDCKNILSSSVILSFEQFNLSFDKSLTKICCNFNNTFIIFISINHPKNIPASIENLSYACLDAPTIASITSLLPFSVPSNKNLSQLSTGWSTLPLSVIINSFDSL